MPEMSAIFVLVCYFLLGEYVLCHNLPISQNALMRYVSFPHFIYSFFSTC